MFDDQGARKLDENISVLVMKITKIIKNSESKLKEMQNEDAMLLTEQSDLADTSAE